MWQPLLAVYDWFDGPREGVTRFEGRLHHFASAFDTDTDEWSDVFLLRPLPEDLAEAVFEAWAIWRRWQTAFQDGAQTVATHPALPHERARSEALKAQIEAAISAAKRTAPVRATARLRGDLWRCEDAEAEWTVVD